MTNLVVEVSRYLIILLIAIYTYYNFRFFSMKDQEGRDLACSRQLVCMFMLHFLANMVIVLNTGLESLALFYGAQVIFFLCYIYLYRFFYRNVSRLLVNNTCMLLCTSFIMLTRLNPSRAMRQFVIVAAAAVITWIIPLIIDRVWQLAKIPWIYCGLGLALLSAVCLLGNTSYGAQLSISIGGFSFQPSEFVKISFVFFVATMFYRSTDFKTIAVTTAAAAAVVTAMVYHMFSHVRRRIQAWRDPWSDVDDIGYQAAQSLFAIGTGGWFGMGLYQGMPEKIPVVDKDFIFSAVSEELGGIYALCLLFICVGCFLQFMLIATKMQAMFYKLIAFGLGTVYITQVFLTVGGATKFIPSTGVTLPFVSYGGSSVLATFILFNIIQGLYILKRGEEEEDEKDQAKSQGQ